jgi:hypothetical protein
MANWRRAFLQFAGPFAVKLIYLGGIAPTTLRDPSPALAAPVTPLLEILRCPFQVGQYD